MGICTSFSTADMSSSKLLLTCEACWVSSRWWRYGLVPSPLLPPTSFNSSSHSQSHRTRVASDIKQGLWLSGGRVSWLRAAINRERGCFIPEGNGLHSFDKSHEIVVELVGVGQKGWVGWWASVVVSVRYSPISKVLAPNLA